jgi:hypothetical protein
MDDKTKALWDAAFHTWVALGELLTDDPRPEYHTPEARADQRAELATCFAELEAAIQALNSERKADGRELQ